VGYTDLRAIFDSLFPAYSTKKSMKEEIKATLELLNTVGELLRTDGAGCYYLFITFRLLRNEYGMARADAKRDMD
jgi:hypothetical protein